MWGVSLFGACPLRPLKQHLSREAQLELLKARGLVVSDDDRALLTIERLGYYRLSGYFYPLRRTRPVGEPGRLDDFVGGASIELVESLAEFDKGLRLLALDAIEAIEIAVRVAVAHRLGRLNAEAHLTESLLDRGFTLPDPRGLHGTSKHQQWIERFEEACTKSREDFCKHHKANYGGKMPIWVAIELWDFGSLSRFFEGMQRRDQQAIAGAFGSIDGAILTNWLRSLSFVRNVSAHHARLWNRTMVDVIKLPALERCRILSPLHRNSRAVEKLFGPLTCARFLLRRINPKSKWHEKLKAHIASFPATTLLSLEAAGFSTGWEN